MTRIPADTRLGLLNLPVEIEAVAAGNLLSPELQKLVLTNCLGANFISAVMESNGISASAMKQLASQLYENATQFSVISIPNEQSSSSLDINTSQQLRNKVKQDALMLFHLASGPSEYVAHIALNHQYTICLRYLCHFKVFAAVPTRNSISFSNLSIITSTPLATLTSVIKMAATSGLFTIIAADRVSHSPTSLLLATSPEFNGWATCVSQYMFDASSKLGAASEAWGRSTEMAHSPFSMAFGTDLSFPEYLGQNPLVAKSMGQFLNATQMVDANSPRHLVNTTSAVPTIYLAQAFPLLNFELEAQERALKSIGDVIHALESELQARISITSQGPKGPEPVSNGIAIVKANKVFLLRHFLHNLPDPVAAKMLAVVAARLGPGDRLLIQDLVIPEPNEIDQYTEGMLRMRELIQVELANGRTRTEAMWTNLIDSIGVGAKVKSIVRPEGSDLSLMEVEIDSRVS
ncbi:hypothetical protein BKA65DRAFT_485121 [Rhexocercosporidium sp. MPI-PUGE-AT-0058]|nr:hypothetical protein BKA65DRAFT_485121 [Rhexocercosporidium sp. MPI-PUGE-AT-0058]